MLRRALLLLCLGVLGMSAYLTAPRLAEAATCNTTCPEGATLSCCTSGTCSTVNGSSVTCNGTVMSCAPADTYKACIDTCNANDCTEGCNVPAVCRACERIYQRCVTACGPPPVTNIGC